MAVAVGASTSVFSGVVAGGDFTTQPELFVDTVEMVVVMVLLIQVVAIAGVVDVGALADSLFTPPFN